MSIYSLIAFNAATNQLKQNQVDAQNLAQAKQKTEEQATALDIQKRTAEAQIKIANNAGQINDYQTQNQLDVLKKIHGALNDKVEADQDAQDLTQHKIEQQNQQATNALKFTAQDPDVQNHLSNMFATINKNAQGALSSPTQGGTAPMANPSDATSVPTASTPSIVPQNTAPQAIQNANKGGLNLAGLEGAGIVPPVTGNSAGQPTLSLQGIDAQTRAGGVQQPSMPAQSPSSNVAPAVKPPDYITGANIPPAQPAAAQDERFGGMSDVQNKIKQQFGAASMVDMSGNVVQDPVYMKSLEAQQTALAQQSTPQAKELLELKQKEFDVKNLKTAEDYIQSALKTSRSPIGQQDIKVNSAIHARQLIDQAYDPKTGKYDITQVPYSELTESLGNLLTGTTGTSEGRVDALRQSTLYGTVSKMVSFMESKPTDATSQAVIKQLVGMIDRQGVVSEDLRDKAIDNIRTSPIFKRLAPEDYDGIMKQDFGNSFRDELQKAPDRIQANNNSFDSEAEAEKANLPSGTIIMINGRRAKVN